MSTYQKILIIVSHWIPVQTILSTLHKIRRPLIVWCDIKKNAQEKINQDRGKTDMQIQRNIDNIDNVDDNIGEKEMSKKNSINKFERMTTCTLANRRAF